MTTNTYPVRGMHCASCASLIEKTLKKVDGVHAVEVNVGTEAAKISYDESKTNPQSLSDKLSPLGYTLALAPSASALMTAREMGMSEDDHRAHLGLNQSKAEKLMELAAMKTKIIAIMPMTAFAVVVMAWNILAEFGQVAAVPAAWNDSFNLVLALMATYALFVVGKPYLIGFYRFLRHGAAN